MNRFIRIQIPEECYEFLKLVAQKNIGCPCDGCGDRLFQTAEDVATSILVGEFADCMEKARESLEAERNGFQRNHFSDR